MIGETAEESPKALERLQARPIVHRGIPGTSHTSARSTSRSGGRSSRWGHEAVDVS